MIEQNGVMLCKKFCYGFKIIERLGCCCCSVLKWLVCFYYFKLLTPVIKIYKRYIFRNEVTFNFTNNTMHLHLMSSSLQDLWPKLLISVFLTKR